MPLKLELVAPRYQSLAPLDAARNGYHANGKVARAIAEGANFHLGRSLRMIPGHSVDPSSARNVTTADLALWRTRYPASVNGTTLVIEVLLLPTDNNNAQQPQWYVKIDGAASTKRSHNIRCSAGSGLNTSDMFTDKLEVTVTANAEHNVELYTSNCRVVSWHLREKERDSLAIGTDTAVDWTTLGPAQGINTVDMASLNSALEQVRKRQNGLAISWNVDDPATPIIDAHGDATYRNIWDGGSPGTITLPLPTQYRATYRALYGGPRIPCVVWTYAERTAGAGSGRVRFSGSAGAVSLIVNAAAQYWTGIWNVFDQAGGDPITLLTETDAGVTMKVYAAGLYALN